MPHAHLLAGLCLAVMTLPACQGSASSLEAPPSALSPSPTVARPFGPQDDGLSTTAQEPAFTDSPVDGSGQDMTPTGGGQVATPAVPEFSRIYYVATDGSDNAVGSSSLPSAPWNVPRRW